MLLLGLHNVLLSKWTCFVQYVKVALQYILTVLVLLSTIMPNFKDFSTIIEAATCSLAKGLVCSRPVTSFSRGGTHLLTPTSVLLYPPLVPRIWAPLTGGNTSRVNNVFSQVVPSWGSDQTHRKRRETRVYNHTSSSVRLYFELNCKDSMDNLKMTTLTCWC